MFVLSGLTLPFLYLTLHPLTYDLWTPDLCTLCYRSSGEGLVMDALTAAHHHHHLPVPADGPLWPENHEELSCIWDEAPPVYLQYWRCSVLCLPVKRGGLTKTLMHVTKLIRADHLSLSSTPPTSYFCWMWVGFWNEQGSVYKWCNYHVIMTHF